MAFDDLASIRPYTYAHAMVTKYRERISGMMLDGMDIRIEVPQVAYNKL